MALIDASYFIGPVNIPNTSDAVTLASLNACIKKYEPELLQKVFGYAFYKLFIDALNPATTTPDNPEITDASSTTEGTQPADQRWLDLRDGKEYTNLAGYQVRWRGIIEKITDTQKQSFIANYVYYWFVRNKITETTGVGEVAPDTENGAVVSPAIKLSRTWNEMVCWIWEMIYFLDANTDTYPEWLNADRSGLYSFRKMNPFF